MAVVEQYSGTTADNRPVTAIYAEQREAQLGFAIAIIDHQLPRIVHWGRPVGERDNRQWLLNLADVQQPQRVSGALDYTPWPSVLPTQSESWTGADRFVVRRDGVALFCKFVVTSQTAEVVAREHGNSEYAVITVQAVDNVQQIALTWVCEVLEGGAIRQSAQVHNLADTALDVETVELGFAVPQYATEILTTTGHHLRERSPQRGSLTVGRFEKVAMMGRPDFDATLLLTLGQPGFSFDHGEAYAVSLGWSGNSKLSAERSPYTNGVIGGSEVLFGGEVSLQHGESYSSPWLYGSYGDGLNEIAARFHSVIRSWHANIAVKPRPVILNTWEAVYFDHSFETLRDLADKAAQVGVERFVVDDGWFMHRRDDTAGLGDWQVDEAVWPGGADGGERSLKALADYVHGLGMEFGLWFEPEMINPDSDTARAHPDWILKPTANRLPMQGRMQQVLDLTNPEAFAYVYACMDELIGKLGIDYIKWDHNKLVTEAVSMHSGKPAVHAQTLAVYKIFHDLKAAHQGLEIESCSSGGGRVDLGILQYADRIWASDCVDPVERADIQRYTSLLVPPEMIGEHVGDSPAHSTKRATSQELRMAMAFFGHLGVEWNLLKQPQESLAALAPWISAFKQYRKVFATGTTVHGDEQDPAVRLDGVVARDQSVALYRFTQLTTSQTYPASPVRLPGLDSQAQYRIKPLSTCLDVADITNAQSVLGWWTSQGTELSAQVLESYGVRMPSLHPAQAVVVVAERI